MTTQKATREERFWAKVNFLDPSGCWVWTASKDHGGYGWFKADNKMHRAHRWGYKTFVAEIDDELEVDHLCGNRACVRLDHLEAVTAFVNTDRQPGVDKTHCINGHELTIGNTYWRTDSVGLRRRCRKCINTAARRYYQRKTERV